MNLNPGSKGMLWPFHKESEFNKIPHLKTNKLDPQIMQEHYRRQQLIQIALLTSFGILLFLSSITVYGQERFNQPVQIGERLPEAIWKLPLAVVNHPKGKTTVSLEEYMGKLIILDFFATSCASCIQAIPQMTAVQQDFLGDLLILPVTYEKPDRVQSAISRSPPLKGMSLPVVVQDLELKKFFPHTYISHLVWIGPDQIVRAFTKPDYVTAGNIRELLSRGEVNWPEKRDFPDYDFKQSLLVLNRVNLPGLSYPTTALHSTFTSNLANISYRYSRTTDSAGSIQRIAMLNHSILQLYLRGNALFSFPLSHVVLEGREPAYFMYRKSDGFKREWERDHTFSYETVLPLGISEEKLLARINADLDFYLGTESRMEKRKISCLSLQNATVASFDSIDASQSDSQQPLERITLAELVAHLNQTPLSSPVFIGDADPSRSVLLTKEELYDLPSLERRLEDYGLEFRQEEKVLDLFILKKLPE